VWVSGRRAGFLSLRQIIQSGTLTPRPAAFLPWNRGEAAAGVCDRHTASIERFGSGNALFSPPLATAISGGPRQLLRVTPAHWSITDTDKSSADAVAEAAARVFDSHTYVPWTSICGNCRWTCELDGCSSTGPRSALLRLRRQHCDVAHPNIGQYR